MSQLNLYPLPYTAPQPPQELVRPVQTVSGRSDTAAFATGLEDRDVFLGKRRCVICGYEDNLQHCHIVGRTDIETWTLLKQLGWSPVGVKESPGHESRNGLLMCPNHCLGFNKLLFFIRYQPTTKRYIYVHYNNCGHLAQFHGKAIGLNIEDTRAPLPLLFLAHEYSDWMIREGMVNEKEDGSFTFNRKAPTSGPLAASGSRSLVMPPTADLTEELKAYQHTMPSWKAWLREAMGWEGTAEENTKKYVENIGVESGQLAE
ncbi:hypothetical protein F5888DRAFT_1905132 [Russula emetica]|nr:hypothetical protein F5888DRAFT_1905132 [Russula emetica]